MNRIAPVMTVNGRTANSRQWEPGDIVLDAWSSPVSENFLRVITCGGNGVCRCRYASGRRQQGVRYYRVVDLLNPIDFGFDPNGERL